jgi:uncharacterized protein YegL
METLENFVVSKPRPLPVLLLADISGSMQAHGKIDALNDAVEDMIQSFAGEEVGHAEIQVGVITFGREARLHQPLTSAKEMRWTPLTAHGSTPMGAALDLVRTMLEDREQIPSRAYRPAVILISDGEPTDKWEEPLQQLLRSDRGARASRFAMAIGADANKAVLESFLDGSDAPLFDAAEARQIRQFFRWVTMSVSMRSRSTNPNQIPALDLLDDDIPY